MWPAPPDSSLDGGGGATPVGAGCAGLRAARVATQSGRAPPSAVARVTRHGALIPPGTTPPRRNAADYPVLKHGPRSATWVRVFGRKPRGRKETERGGNPPPGAGHHRPITIRGKRFEYEHPRSDPKGGELCQARVKPRETLVEARSGSNVQIDRQSLV